MWCAPFTRALRTDTNALAQLLKPKKTQPKILTSQIRQYVDVYLDIEFSTLLIFQPLALCVSPSSALDLNYLCHGAFEVCVCVCFFFACSHSHIHSFGPIRMLLFFTIFQHFSGPPFRCQWLPIKSPRRCVHLIRMHIIKCRPITRLNSCSDCWK